MNCSDDLIIDHINHDKSDNRKSNLRMCTVAQNNFNKGLSKNNTSGIIGVYWSKKDRKWRSRIMINRKSISLGMFNNLEDAIRARLQAEVNYFGEYAPQQYLFKQYNIKYHN